jgi:hypothetical protein
MWTAKRLDRMDARLEELAQRLDSGLEKQAARTQEIADADASQTRRVENRVKAARSELRDVAERLERVERKLDAHSRRLDRHLGALDTEVVRARLKSQPDYLDFFTVAEEVIDSGRTLLDYSRLYILWQAVMNVSELDRPLVEIGTYRGGSALFLAEVAKRRRGAEAEVHVFDTFEGHLASRLSEHDSVYHHAGRFGDTTLAEVTDYLGGFARLSIHVGDVSETLPALDLPEVGLAHVDLDLFDPTLDCLLQLRDRVPVGGVIVVDDYDAPKCPGVKLAVQAFLADTDGFQLWPVLTEQAVLVRVTASELQDLPSDPTVDARAGA